jgi:hypothetical protein
MLGLKARDIAIWIAYSAMLVVVVPWHEPWSDEAQAWLLARDLSIPQLIFYNLRYESHPALWYLILWIPSHLHWGYASLGWISAAIAACGIYVLLRFAPFPFYLRAILPFTFFLAYQYAVVARSYVLFPLLCFLIAHFYRKTPARPVPMAILLALLANVSVHGTLVACALVPAYGWTVFRRRGVGNLSRRSLATAAAIFLASIVFVAITVRPPSDLRPIAPPTVYRALHLQLPQGPVATQQSTSAPHIDRPLDTERATPHPSRLQFHLPHRLADLPRVLSYAVSTSRILSFALYLVAAIYLYSRKQLLLLAPLAALALFLGFVYAREWHLGLLWVVLLAVLWAAWDAGPHTNRLRLQHALASLLVLVSLLQFPWTWNAVRYDLHSQYYPATQAAAYIHTLPPGLRIAGFGDTSTILPYFGKNIFFNQLPTAFIWNSTRNTMFADASKIISAHPDLVIVWSGDTSSLDIARSNGYNETTASAAPCSCRTSTLRRPAMSSSKHHPGQTQGRS